MEKRIGMQPFCRQRRFNNLFAHRLAQVFLRNIGAVLGRQHHRFYPLGLAVCAIAHRDLAFRVRSQPRKRACLAQLSLFFDQTMGVVNGCRHEDVGFIRGETKHQALIACALTSLIRLMGAQSDVR